ncbi:MAG: 16S rRNA (guanine(527)-N(7))-methyltransferase RsmG [Chitinophagaceae bacterium]|nr:16S rRNA (guanine(527)-N(7))-methyltransferase RsmG [Chitinophagaceae bacterium]MCW5928551.1 16S rRNA (guanine(527)-N(7))-methyltransferase RsmG [Chitinophagaceae bacterium]
MEIVTGFFSGFTEMQLSQLRALGGIYKEWNEKINVISRKDIDSLYEKHVLHSLSIAAVFDFPPGLKVIDIGTGGGFPGIPLAIMFPELNFTLVDSIGKKLKVVDAVADALQLKNVKTRHSRAEDIKDEKFDFVVSRAVAPLKDLWRWGKPLLIKGKKMPDFVNGLICLKGGDLRAEIKESGLHPHIWDISSIFEGQTWFKEKFLLYVPL